MEKRIYGRTGMNISILGFGCGAVGGLMVRGSAADQEKAVARALEVGINYFDTAVQYGMGASETNLGRTLKTLKPAEAFVGTKVRLPAADFGRIAAAVTESLNASLARLQMDHVDIFHLHNAITVNGGGDTLSATQVLNEVVPAFEALRKAGKTRFLGITAVGETAALLRVIDAEKFDSAQVSYNMLNPSAGEALPAGYPAQDYGRMFDHTKKAGVGVVGIRVIAVCAERRPTRAIRLPRRHRSRSARRPPTTPMWARARRLLPLVSEGFAGSLPEAATRFAITHPAMGTILVGMATVDEFEAGLAAVQKGLLPPAAMARLSELRAGFSGESR